MASTEGGAGPIVEDPDMTIQIAAGDGEMEILKRFIQAGVSGLLIKRLGCCAFLPL